MGGEEGVVQAKAVLPPILHAQWERQQGMRGYRSCLLGFEQAATIVCRAALVAGGSKLSKQRGIPPDHQPPQQLQLATALAFTAAGWASRLQDRSVSGFAFVPAC